MIFLKSFIWDIYRKWEVFDYFGHYLYVKILSIKNNDTFPHQWGIFLLHMVLNILYDLMNDTWYDDLQQITLVNKSVIVDHGQKVGWNNTRTPLIWCQIITGLYGHHIENIVKPEITFPKIVQDKQSMSLSQSSKWKWIYWSQSNSWIYFYIVLNQNWKIYWSKQSFTGLLSIIELYCNFSCIPNIENKSQVIEESELADELNTIDVQLHVIYFWHLKC